MIASPSAAIDLPLKILLSEDSAADVWVSYNSTSYLQARHGVALEPAMKILLWKIWRRLQANEAR